MKTANKSKSALSNQSAVSAFWLLWEIRGPKSPLTMKKQSTYWPVCLKTTKRKCYDINSDFLLLYFYRFSHGSCAECRWLLLPHAVRVPSVMAWRRSPAADYQPAGGDEPRSCSPVPGPGSHQLLLHLRPQSDETPTLLGGIKPISCFYDGCSHKLSVGRAKACNQLTFVSAKGCTDL